MEIRYSNERGQADHGWLKAKHSFSFAHYYDLEHMGFSDLIVINEDRILPGRGFATHGHKDMEIFTYILEGALKHEDSMGNGSIIYPGDVQVMSAGSGVRHSEFNASNTEGVHLLQIWLMPQANNLPPSYQQYHYSEEEKRGVLRLILSPTKENGSLLINQDARIYAGLFDKGEKVRFKVNENRYVYIHVARGSIQINQQQLHAGDAVKLRKSGEISIENGEEAEILLFDLRPIENVR